MTEHIHFETLVERARHERVTESKACSDDAEFVIAFFSNQSTKQSVSMMPWRAEAIVRPILADTAYSAPTHSRGLRLP